MNDQDKRTDLKEQREARVQKMKRTTFSEYRFF